MKASRIKNSAHHWLQAISAQAHRWLALAVFVSGLWFISPLVLGVLQNQHLAWLDQSSWRAVIDAVGLAQLPRVVIAFSLVLMAFGLLGRARVAWTFTLVMLTPAIAISLYTHHGQLQADVVYNTAVYLALLRHWQAFNHSSVAAGTLFALSSLVSLFWYAMLGVLYLGQQFSPKVLTLPDAIYFSIVAVATVGFGDIVPVTETARLFVVSIILLGVTVFTTALGAIVTPAAAGAFRQILQRKARLSMKKNHIILCGATPLATTLYQNLVGRGENVTVIVKPDVIHNYPDNTDLIVGDATADETLQQAGAKQASHVLAMCADDPDNAFIVLAVKGIAGCQARTVAVVNNSHNLEKVRSVKPDLVFSPQLLSAELLSRVLRGETFDAQLIADLFVFKPTPAKADQSPAGPTK